MVMWGWWETIKQLSLKAEWKCALTMLGELSHQKILTHWRLKSSVTRKVFWEEVSGKHGSGFSFVSFSMHSSFTLPIWQQFIVCELTSVKALGPYSYQASTASEVKSHSLSVRFLESQSSSFAWVIQMMLEFTVKVVQLFTTIAFCCLWFECVLSLQPSVQTFLKKMNFMVTMYGLEILLLKEQCSKLASSSVQT